MRHGQEVIVTDSKMEGYLPVAHPDPVVTSHLPAEVLLRFASSHLGASHVFLHAMGATATFGRDFGSANTSTDFAIDGKPIKVVLPPTTDRSGCAKLARPPESEFVFLLDRGGCLFSDKLFHAAQAGASGVILVDKHDPLHPGNHEPLPEGSLIRPSADDSPSDVLDAVKDVGMVFISGQVGDIVKKTIEKEGQSVVVELWAVDTGMKDAAEVGAKTEKGGKSREGRMALGLWEIWNLRIVEAI